MRWVILVKNSQKVCFQRLKMLRLRELGHEECLAANSQSTSPQQQNTDDHSCPVDNTERLSSADWRTADVVDWRRRLLCTAERCSMKTSVHQHGELELYSVGRASGVRSAVSATSRYRTSEVPSVANDAGSQSSSHAATCLLWPSATRPVGAYDVTVVKVNARSHKGMDECCCWLRVQGS